MLRNITFARACRVFVVLAMITFTQKAYAEMSTLEFQDKASETILNTLKAQPQNSFLSQLYARLLYVPVWVSPSGLTPYAEEFFAQMRNDGTLDRQGKLYQDMLRLEDQAAAVGDSLADKLTLEFKISQLYKGYADYSIYGSINWGAFLARLWNIKTKDIHADWVTHKPKIDPIMVLEDTVLNGSFSQAFNKAIPTRYHYRQLQERLAEYMQLKEQGGWQNIHFKGKLKPGNHYQVVPAIRERLRITGDYQGCGNEDLDTTLYDRCLKQAVIRYQARNGLVATGIINTKTKRAMNKSIDARIMTLRLNLDRLKWLRDPPQGEHIWINIPAFMLYVKENNAVLKKIKVIVGKPDHPTPIFSDSVETIVLNPYWNIPQSIIQKEMIPKLLRNPKSLKRKGIKIYDGWGSSAKEVNPSRVNWARYQYSDKVPFRFAQMPGKRNALGKIKFLFPNAFSVYMHDTPNKKLFRRNVRAFSHGCVRLADPRGLLKTFSSFEPNVDYKKAQKILKGKKKSSIQLPQKVPVDITYLTAWIDNDGKLQFRNDIYRYDKMQLQAYRKW